MKGTFKLGMTESLALHQARELNTKDQAEIKQLEATIQKARERAKARLEGALGAIFGDRDEEIPPGAKVEVKVDEETQLPTFVLWESPDADAAPASSSEPA